MCKKGTKWLPLYIECILYMEEVVMKRIYVVLKYPRHTEIYRIIFSFKLDHEINENVTLSPRVYRYILRNRGQ